MQEYRHLIPFVRTILLAWSLFSIVACRSGGGGSPVKFQQYVVEGARLYLTHCSNCHQKDGSGLGLLYPPVNKSDFMDASLTKTICIIRNGASGEMIVDGRSFNKIMPGDPALTDLEIAEIATYIYNSWGRERGIIDVSTVTETVSTCEE